ncbi:MAG: hypothetical protein RL385_150 [Pseudomonadota bacterium]|jgi:hypothetical protein
MAFVVLVPTRRRIRGAVAGRRPTLDLARARLRETDEPTGGGPPRAPHLRRAHWHRFWTGPRDGERAIRLRWLSPILVGADSVPEHATVIPVREQP